MWASYHHYGGFQFSSTTISRYVPFPHSPKREGKANHLAAASSFPSFAQSAVSSSSSSSFSSSSPSAAAGTDVPAPAGASLSSHSFATAAAPAGAAAGGGGGGVAHAESQNKWSRFWLSSHWTAIFFPFHLSAFTVAPCRRFFISFTLARAWQRVAFAIHIFILHCTIGARSRCCVVVVVDFIGARPVKAEPQRVLSQHFGGEDKDASERTVVIIEAPEILECLRSIVSSCCPKLFCSIHLFT